MAYESTTDNFQIRNADKITFVGTSNTIIDTTTGRIQTNGFQHNSNVILDISTGDHSVDTSIISKFTDPQTTNVRVLVDGLTEVGTNQIVNGPDPVGNEVSYDSDEKYWIINGTDTSNISVEANTFIENNDAHSVSIWFNSSNIEENVSNTCIVSIASVINLNTNNVNIQQNTWHNLTYTYEGLGGSQIIYLDGRQVSNTYTDVNLPTNTTSIPIQFGGGNINKIANFRVYDAFIDRNRVMEIWDAYKDYFGRAKSQLTIRQGKLGIATQYPDTRFSISDNPHIIEKIPSKPITAYDGEFKVSASSIHSNTTAYNAFNNMTVNDVLDHSPPIGSPPYIHWSQDGSGDYNITTGDWTGGYINSVTTTNVEGVNRYGHWLQIEFPHKVKYNHSVIQGPFGHTGNQPHTGCIVGTNDLTNAWTILDDFSGKVRNYSYHSVTYKPSNLVTQYFKYIRLVIEKLGTGGSRAGIDQWDIYAVREEEQTTIDDGTLILSRKLDIRGDLYYSGMLRNLSYMEDVIRSWNPHYWWDMDDDQYLEGGLNEGDTINYVHNKSGNWVDNYLSATNCITRYINGRRFWTGTDSSGRMVSRDKDVFGGGVTEKIGDLTSIFHVACTSPYEINRVGGYYHDSFSSSDRNFVAWDSITGTRNGELILYNGSEYGLDDGGTSTAGGILGLGGSSNTDRAVHCIMSKANNAFNRNETTHARGINNHISVATLTRGNLTNNLSSVITNPGTNTSDAIVWGNKYSHDVHNPGNFFYAEMIVFKRNRGIISQSQVNFLQEYFRFKYQQGGIGLQYSV